MSDDLATFEVVFRKGDAWAQIVSTPFIPTLSRAWVSMKAVHPTAGGAKP